MSKIILNYISHKTLKIKFEKMGKENTSHFPLFSLKTSY